MSEDLSDAARPASALGAYSEALLRGRRVGVLGDATSRLGELLLERGARLVHVFDPDPGRLAVAAATRAGDAPARTHRPVAALLGEDLGVRDGAFDVVVVPDLSLFDDPQDIIRRIRKLVGIAGLAIVASPNPESQRFLLPPSGSLDRALGYYELYDIVSLQFPEVKMLGQAPFVGYSIVDFGESDPDVSVDTSLLEEPELPEWYVVVASDRPVDVDSYALVEIPMADVARLNSAPEPVTVPRELANAAREAARGPTDREVALTEAQTRISVLLTENETLREQLKDKLRADRAMEHASVRSAELEADVATLRQKNVELSGQLEDERSRAEQLQADVRRLGDGLEAARRARESSTHAEAERVRLAEQQLAAARRRVSELEAQVAAIEPPTLRSKEMQQKLVAALEAQKAEMAEHEARLQGRLRALEADVARATADVARVSAERDALADRLRDQAAAADERVRALEEAHRAERESAADDAQRVQPLEQEIRRLEGVLRERGREMTKVQRDLRDTERVGRELLFELEALRTRSGEGSGSTGGGGVIPGKGNAGPGATDLAERAARAEADLMAAGWKIAKLERELSRHKSASAGEPSDTVRELEIALAAAQREIAALRTRPASSLSSDEAAEAASVMEEAVLLQQVERERAGREERP